MATQDLVKIALKSSHKMSLNERFQLLRQQNQMKRQNNSLVSNKLVQNNANRHQLRQGSQKNRRLALQMANRPSVLAALRTNANQNNGINRSVKQRLGFKKFNNQLNNQSNPLNVNRNQTKTRINRMNFNSNLNRNPNLNPNRNLNRNPNRNLNRNPNRNLNRNLNRNRKPNGRMNSQNIGVIVGVRRKGIKPFVDFFGTVSHYNENVLFQVLKELLWVELKPWGHQQMWPDLNPREESVPKIEAKIRPSRDRRSGSNSTETSTHGIIPENKTFRRSLTSNQTENSWTTIWINIWLKLRPIWTQNSTHICLKLELIPTFDLNLLFETFIGSHSVLNNRI